MSLIQKEKGGGRERGLTVRKRQQKSLADNSMGWGWGREILGKGTSPLQMIVTASSSLPEGVLEDSPQAPTTEGGATFQSVARCSFTHASSSARQAAKPSVCRKPNHEAPFLLPPRYTQSPINNYYPVSLKSAQVLKVPPRGERTWSPFFPASTPGRRLG